MERLNINELNIKELEQIPIPEGLEERLSAKIDEWDAASRTVAIPSTPHRGFLSPDNGGTEGGAKTIEAGRGSWRAFALAASFILVCGIGLYFALAPTNKGTIDTYDDPQLACQEAENALQLLATNLNKGMAQYEAVNAKSRQAEEILNKQLTKLN